MINKKDKKNLVGTFPINLIGKRVVRCKKNVRGDASFMKEPIEIIKVYDTYMIYRTCWEKDQQVQMILPDEWLDDAWVDYNIVLFNAAKEQMFPLLPALKEKWEWLDMETIQLKQEMNISITGKDIFQAIKLEVGDMIELDGKEVKVLFRNQASVTFCNEKNRAFTLQNIDLVYDAVRFS